MTDSPRATPDPDRSRRQLRRLRVLNALGQAGSGDPKSHRDALLPRLGHYSVNLAEEFGNLSDTEVDALVSLAVTEVIESPVDALQVLLLSVQCLAADGQFARLRQLEGRVLRLGKQLVVERRILAAACEGLAAILRGQRHAMDELVRRTVETPIGNSASYTEQMSDALCLSAVKVAAEAQAVASIEVLEAAASLSIELGDGMAHAFIDAVREVVRAEHLADTRAVLRQHDSTFRLPAMRPYLDELARPLLFPAQIHAIEAGATTRHRTVVALPTSSGKTFLAELRIAATLVRRPGTRALYIAPYRLLARQVEASMQPGLAPLQLSVRDLGSFFDTTDLLSEPGAPAPDIAVMTPERLDSILRLRASDREGADQARELIDSLSLVVFDELQLVGRPGRGPRLEMVLSRLMQLLPDVEFLGLSPSSHGADDLARWLTGTDEITGPRRPTGTIEVAWQTDGRLLQRVPRNRAFVGELERSDQPMADATRLMLQLEEAHLPVLAVCTQQDRAENLAKRLAQAGAGTLKSWWGSLNEGDQVLLGRVAEAVSFTLGESHSLADLIRNGIAFHHAALPANILRHIETLAAARLLRFVCATTTMAEGADLPFRTVVIPHLDFAGPSRALERDLYLNLIGRAGRANVSVEGIVFVLESSASTLKDLVRSRLWSDTQTDRIRSRLLQVPQRITNFDDWDSFFDVQNQVMGWLGDSEENYRENQAQGLSAGTLAWSAGDRADRQSTSKLFASCLNDLETRGLALAASPFRLTDDGKAARLTGLGAPSFAALNAYVTEEVAQALGSLEGTVSVTVEQARQIATLTLHTFEGLRASLWLRRESTDERIKFRILAELARSSRPWPSNDALFEVDVALLASWIRGNSLTTIGEMAPLAARKNSLFGNSEPERLASDASLHCSRMSFAAAMSWGAARVLYPTALKDAPNFLRQAIESGVPNEAAAKLTSLGVSREAATLITEETSPSWEGLAQGLSSFTVGDLRTSFPLSEIDAERVVAAVTPRG